jgi:hypothetical protein
MVRFALCELAIWAGVYGIYLAVRGVAIASPAEAFANAQSLVHFERALNLFHEAQIQRVFDGVLDAFSAYYMLGFAPTLAVALVWLGLRRPASYRGLRTALLVSIGVAAIVYVLYPAAPPRLVPGLGIDDTVGLAGHDTGSFAGIKFNPYAAMPSMHVGWSVLLAIYLFPLARRRLLRAAIVAHPLAMALTVTVTGNHYLVDAAAGTAIALLSLLLIRACARVLALRAAAAAAT